MEDLTLTGPSCEISLDDSPMPSNGLKWSDDAKIRRTYCKKQRFAQAPVKENDIDCAAHSKPHHVTALNASLGNVLFGEPRRLGNELAFFWKLL
jgi:hypothetical protein